MLAAGSLVSAASAFRVSANALELLVERAPSLVRLAVEASAGFADTGSAQAAFRDELIALVRDSAELSWRELRRAVDEFDALTRPADGRPERPRRRPHRVKP